VTVFIVQLTTVRSLDVGIDAIFVVVLIRVALSLVSRTSKCKLPASGVGIASRVAVARIRRLELGGTWKTEVFQPSSGTEPLIGFRGKAPECSEQFLFFLIENFA